MGFIKYRNGVILTVWCKREECSNIVLMQHDGRLMPTSEYAEITLLMADADGIFTNHESAICKACQADIEAMTSQEQQPILEHIYAEDVEQWEVDAHISGTPDAETRAFLAEMAARRVVRLLPEHGRGEAELR